MSEENLYLSEENLYLSEENLYLSEENLCLSEENLYLSEENLKRRNCGFMLQRHLINGFKRGSFPCKLKIFFIYPN
jgi:hypothetical protein